MHEFTSVRWYKFVKKIIIFQSLIKGKRFFEASIVYEDVQYELVNFDPKDYFPGLFFPLYKNLAPNARVIYQHIEQNADSLEWHIAKKLYQSDPMRFLRDLPMMVENKYNEEQFHKGDYQAQAKDERRKLMDDASSLTESVAVSFANEDNETGDLEDTLGKDDEVQDLLAEIEDVWDQAGLSD